MLLTWTLVGVIVTSTAAGEILQAKGMRHHGEVHDFRPGAIGRMLAMLARNRYIGASVVAMAISFFAFMSLLSITDLSFAVPVTAITYVVETALARVLLKERICRGRWAGASLVALGVALLAL
jgi:bacterial/archaeal transporter family protein